MDIRFFKQTHKLGYLEEKFVDKVFLPLLGEEKLRNLEVEVNIPKNNGKEGYWRLDFIYMAKNKAYVIECDGFKYHASDISKEYFDNLESKSNEIVRNDFKLVRLTANQIDDNPEEGIAEFKKTLEAFGDL